MTGDLEPLPSAVYVAAPGAGPAAVADDLPGVPGHVVRADGGEGPVAASDSVAPGTVGEMLLVRLPDTPDSQRLLQRHRKTVSGRACIRYLARVSGLSWPLRIVCSLG